MSYGIKKLEIWFIHLIIIIPITSIKGTFTFLQKYDKNSFTFSSSIYITTVARSMCDLLHSGGPYPSDWSCAAALADPTVICSKPWTGVICDSNYLLSEVSLLDLSISGVLPTSIGYLSSITKLELTGNSFHSTLPVELFNLSNLEVLSLGYNVFTGALPPNIDSLDNLVHLDVSNNKLQSALPNAIGALRNLEKMMLSHNSFTSVIPTAITLLKKLSSLALTGNKFTSSIPTNLSNFTQLATLLLHSNSLTSIIPTSIGSVINLSVLALGANKLDSSIPTTIGLLTKLAWLLLSSNKLTSVIPTTIGALTSLSSLALGSNKLISTIPSEIGLLTKLTFLGLSSNFLTSNIPTEIGYLTKLVYADLSFSRLSSSVPSTISYLNQLSYIALSYNKLTSSLPSAIGNMASMRNLRLRHCKFTSSLPTSIGMLTKLTVLLVSQNSLSSVIPTSLGLLVNVKTLKLGYNSLTSSIPSALGMMAQVLDMQLSFNHFSSSIPTSIGLINNLVRFDVQSNQLTSSIPSTIYVLSNLKYLYLQSNSLRSSVPASILNMTGAIEIAMNNNGFTGTFPVGACQISSLQLLNLANNSFLCVPWCQTDVPWNTPGVSIPRCKTADDVALQEIDRTLGISAAVNKLVTRKIEIIQSEFPLSTQPMMCIQVPSAFRYSISIGPYGYSCPAPMVFCSDATCSHILAKNIATGFKTPLIINGASFCYYAISPFLGTSTSSCSSFSSMGVTMKITTYSNQQQLWLFGMSVPTVMTSVDQDSLQTDTSSTFAVGLCQSDWYGISCTKGQVTSLSLSSLGLRGSVPSAIGLLTGLTSLDLSNNLLSGTIPSSIGLLKNMDTLNMNGNTFTGQIPETVEHMVKLYRCDLSSNLFSGSVPWYFGHMDGLYVLNLDHNLFEFEVPSDVCLGVASHGLAVTLIRNPRLICYQQACWGNESYATSRATFDTALSMCVPTSSPTTVPTYAPTPIDILSQLSSQNAIVGMVGVLIFLIAIIYITWIRCFSTDTIKKKERNKRLNSLPVHRALLSSKGISEDKLLSIIEPNIITVNERDIDNRTALGIILGEKVKVSENIVYRLLRECLPVDAEGNDVDDFKDFEGWFQAVQSGEDYVYHAVVRIIRDHKKHILKLANATDNDGRKCKDVASERCKYRLYRSMYLHERYEIQNEGRHVLHKSHTSIVVFAKDHGAGNDEAPQTNTSPSLATLPDDQFNQPSTPRKLKLMASLSQSIRGMHFGTGNDDASSSSSSSPPLSPVDTNHISMAVERSTCIAVAMKFMRDADQFQREVRFRSETGLHWTYVVSVRDSYGGVTDEDNAFREDAIGKGFGDYPYCIVMEAADDNLKHIVDSECLAGEDWTAIKAMTRQITSALEHIHSKGVVHGDIKPLNVLRVGVTLKLTDMDNSSACTDGQLKGTKCSSGYIAPEMLYFDTDKTVKVLSSDSPMAIKADPSQDMWALGCLLYYLCTGSTIWHVNAEDNIGLQDEFLQLCNWNPASETAQLRLSLVKDHLARNLVSLLLSRDPTKRPSPHRVLAHPFLTGKSGVRLEGEEALWDVFLSYRVTSDLKHVELLYHALTALGLRVWWDKVCLLPGQNWEEGFCKGLVSSANFVCLSSRGAMKDPNKDSQNWEKLTEGSRCDNVLLEWRLALDLKERGMIEGVFPVMIGDQDASGKYGQFFKGGCSPSPPDIVVESVEAKVKEHLSREGLGMPYKESMSVKSVADTVFMNQGGRILGDLDLSVETVCKTVFEMIVMQRQDQSSIAMDTQAADSTDNVSVRPTNAITKRDPKLESEFTYLKTKNQQLEQKISALMSMVESMQSPKADKHECNPEFVKKGTI